MPAPTWGSGVVGIGGLPARGGVSLAHHRHLISFLFFYLGCIHNWADQKEPYLEDLVYSRQVEAQVHSERGC